MNLKGKKKYLKKVIICKICKVEKGKYISEYGCIVCKNHSNFKKVKKDGEDYHICFNCGKMIKNLSLIKKICNICFQENISICHFKCGCTLEVCENCYIKCKKSSNKCPGCRRNIWN